MKHPLPKFLNYIDTSSCDISRIFKARDNIHLGILTMIVLNLFIFSLLIHDVFNSSIIYVIIDFVTMISVGILVDYRYGFET